MYNILYTSVAQDAGPTSSAVPSFVQHPWSCFSLIWAYSKYRTSQICSLVAERLICICRKNLVVTALYLFLVAVLCIRKRLSWSDEIVYIQQLLYVLLIMCRQYNVMYLHEIVYTCMIYTTPPLCSTRVNKPVPNMHKNTIVVQSHISYIQWV